MKYLKSFESVTKPFTNKIMEILGENNSLYEFRDQMVGFSINYKQKVEGFDIFVYVNSGINVYIESNIDIETADFFILIPVNPEDICKLLNNLPLFTKCYRTWLILEPHDIEELPEFMWNDKKYTYDMFLDFIERMPELEIKYDHIINADKIGLM